jgi:hypothetical protein
MFRLPWHRRDRYRGRHWHDLTHPDTTPEAAQLAADMRDEIQRLADAMNEPTAMYRELRVPRWLTFTTHDDDW